MQEQAIAVAVSGGVDSLYALASLKDAGETVMALHGRFREYPAGEDPVPGLAENCARLGIPLHVADLRAAFAEQVMRPFAERYAAGLTPNPCALCNARVKFGLLFDKATELGAARLATGHYARRLAHPKYGEVFGAAADERKDQSYFLSLVPPDRLARALFPLAGITKDAARRAVRALGLTVPLPKESQEICFVPGNDYRAFISQMGITLSGAGPVELAGPERRIIGRHEGLWRYTEGQRHGLGIAWTEPLFVTGKDVVRNTLLVGTAAALRRESCVADQVCLHVSPHLWPEVVWVRVRYRQKAVRAAVSVTEGPAGTRLAIRFAERQAMAAPGQVAAVYDGDGILLAGGFLSPEQPVT